MEEIILPSKIKSEKEKDNEASIIIEPCYPGYGTTLGNALRRALLSSLPGASVTSVKIKGVDHEFSTIEHVKEDVVEIIMNLKSLNVKMFTEKPVKLKLYSKGKKEVKAADIEKVSDVEIVNPDLLIATATHKDAELDMEIMVEQGRGYVPTEQKSARDLEIGTILVDSLFTPVVKVGYRVENIRVGQRTDFDKLIMNVKTNGIISPLEALTEAAKILVNQFTLLAEPEKAIKRTKEEEEKKEIEEKEKEEKPKVEGAPIQELNFSTRTFNALSKAKIRTVDDLVKKSEKELLALEGLGQTALGEIEKALKRLNLKLKE
jgi:DNA-directed RNA polymerase subunit alpha